MTPDTEQPTTLSATTRKSTALWPPSMHGLLRKAIHADDPAERERALMQLLRRYTRTLDDPLQKRWIEVTR